MGQFLKKEKIRQVELKAASSLFSDEARHDGEYKKKPRTFCLPKDRAIENLFPDIRNTAVDYFRTNGIKWHDGKDGNPSNHLCDSQVCCVNFLFPFSDKPEALAKLLRPHFPVASMLPMETTGQFVSFEWIGAENYLGERVPKNGTRTRGANFTSADAAVMFERTDGKKQIVLIEWKYTESYAVARGEPPLKVSKSGTDRTKIYRHLWDKDDCPIQKDLLPSYDSLFVEPFYQFMRQQMLAQEMERAHELGANIVSVLHLCPTHNHDFNTVTSPALAYLDNSALDVWKSLVRMSERFLSVAVEDMFAQVAADGILEMETWAQYIRERYPWVTAM